MTEAFAQASGSTPARPPERTWKWRSLHPDLLRLILERLEKDPPAQLNYGKLLEEQAALAGQSLDVDQLNRLGSDLKKSHEAVKEQAGKSLQEAILAMATNQGHIDAAVRMKMDDLTVGMSDAARKDTLRELLKPKVGLGRAGTMIASVPSVQRENEWRSQQLAAMTSEQLVPLLASRPRLHEFLREHNIDRLVAKMAFDQESANCEHLIHQFKQGKQLDQVAMLERTAFRRRPLSPERLLESARLTYFGDAEEVIAPLRASPTFADPTQPLSGEDIAIVQRVSAHWQSVGKTFYLEQFFNANKLEFGMDHADRLRDALEQGRPTAIPQTSWSGALPEMMTGALWKAVASALNNSRWTPGGILALLVRRGATLPGGQLQLTELNMAADRRNNRRLDSMENRPIAPRPPDLAAPPEAFHAERVARAGHLGTQRPVGTFVSGPSRQPPSSAQIADAMSIGRLLIDGSEDEGQPSRSSRRPGD